MLVYYVVARLLSEEGRTRELGAALEASRSARAQLHQAEHDAMSTARAELQAALEPRGGDECAWRNAAMIFQDYS